MEKKYDSITQIQINTFMEKLEIWKDLFSIKKISTSKIWPHILWKRLATLV
jgi:hypothetical protein